LDIRKLQYLRDTQLDELKDRIAAFIELTERTSFMCEPAKQSCLEIDCPFRLEKNGQHHYLCLQIETLIYTLER
jgi:hypothetical protein